MSTSLASASLAGFCVTADVDTYQDSGELLARTIRILPTISARLTKLTTGA